MKLFGGGDGGILVSLCPSVRPSVLLSVSLSVCLSIRPASCVCSVAPTVLVGSMSYLHIFSSNFRRCVAYKVSCEISKFQFLGVGNHGGAGCISERRRSSCSSSTVIWTSSYTVVWGMFDGWKKITFLMFPLCRHYKARALMYARKGCFTVVVHTRCYTLFARKTQLEMMIKKSTRRVRFIANTVQCHHDTVFLDTQKR